MKKRILVALLLSTVLLLTGCDRYNPAISKLIDTSGNPRNISIAADGELQVHNTSLLETVGTHGTYEGHNAYTFMVLGRRTTWVNTSSLQDVVPFDTGNLTYTELTGSESLELVSSSASDNLTGIGSQKVRIVYLNLTDNLTESAEISMNGTSAVAVPWKAHAIEWMESSQVGSNGVAVGNISLRLAGGGASYEEILAGGNKSMSGRFRVPAGYSGYALEWNGTAVSASPSGSSDFIDFRLRATMDSFTGAKGSVYHFIDSMYAPVVSGMMSMTLPFMKLPPLADIKISGIPSATGLRGDVQVTVVLIAN